MKSTGNPLISATEYQNGAKSCYFETLTTSYREISSNLFQIDKSKDLVISAYFKTENSVANTRVGYKIYYFTDAALTPSVEEGFYTPNASSLTTQGVWEERIYTRKAADIPSDALYCTISLRVGYVSGTGSGTDRVYFDNVVVTNNSITTTTTTTLPEASTTTTTLPEASTTTTTISEASTTTTTISGATTTTTVSGTNILTDLIINEWGDVGTGIDYIEIKNFGSNPVVVNDTNFKIKFGTSQETIVNLTDYLNNSEGNPANKITTTSGVTINAGEIFIVVEKDVSEANITTLRGYSSFTGKIFLSTETTLIGTSKRLSDNFAILEDGASNTWSKTPDPATFKTNVGDSTVSYLKSNFNKSTESTEDTSNWRNGTATVKTCGIENKAD